VRSVSLARHAFWRAFSRRFACAFATGVACVLAASGARASEPPKTSDATKTSDTSTTATTTQKTRDEFNIVPVVGGTTDTGFGGGFFFGLARVVPGAGTAQAPYLWYLDGAAVATMLPKNGHVESPFQDAYAQLTIPRLFGLPARFVVRPSWTWERTLGYYGVGNASSDVPPPGAPDNYFEYGRIHPALDFELRYQLVGPLAGIVGTRFTQTWLEIFPGSKLANDRASPSFEVRHWVNSPDALSVATFRQGVQWDTRDSIVSARRGMFHEATVTIAPGGAGAFTNRYGQTNVTLRGYVPLHPRLTFAVRGVFDALFGDPPFYELVRFADTYAIGGVSGVRGVPGQRFGGKLKAFGNVELRGDIARFRLLDRPMLLSGAAFFDAGRVWADGSDRPDLDGRGLGLKWGIGAGPRLQSGEAFVLRAELAWSPDARPLGGYFTAGQLF
jgi:hypothetical protein